ncbi:MAG: hypothetical protein H6738_25295 [Alphaproteobacteria bacterium]|nr:hypothetical protein [Alphaproteobacteria bacterium]
MLIRTLPDIHKSVMAVGTTEVFYPLTAWYTSLEAASLLQLVLVLTGKSGNFQCRLGIQVASTSTEDQGTAVNPASASTQVTTSGSETFLRFDPNGASDGNIDGSMYFRLGVFCSLSSGSTPAVGNVLLRGTCWR